MRRSCGVLLGVVIAVWAAGAGCSSSQTASAGAMADGSPIVTFQVEGMACRNCANEIAHELKDVPGVVDASVDFDSGKATVALDRDNPATMQQLQGAVSHWKTTHFALEEDPDCLDPERRKAILNQQ